MSEMGLATFDSVASSVLLFTAQPEAPASMLAGAFGWAVNDEINRLPATDDYDHND